MKTSRGGWIGWAVGVAMLAVTANADITNVAPSATLTLGAGSGPVCPAGTFGVGGCAVVDGINYGAEHAAARLKDGDTGTGGIVDGGFYKIDARATLNYDPIYLYFTYGTAQTISGYGKYLSDRADKAPMWGSLEYSTDSGTTWKLAAADRYVAHDSSYNTDGSGTKFPAITATHWRFRSMLVNASGLDSRSRLAWREFYLWNYTGADASSVPATKQVNASMYITSVDVSSDGVAADYNKYYETVRGYEYDSYVNRSGAGVPVTFTYIFDEARAISGFGSNNGNNGTGAITLEYSTDGVNYTTVSGLPGGNLKDFNMDGTDQNWTFAPITAKYWKYTNSNADNNLYQRQVYFFTTVNPAPPPPPGAVILVR